MIPFGCLPLAVFLILLMLLPMLFGQVMVAALMRLHLDPQTAVLLVLGILMGSVVNIPVRRIVREEEVLSNPFAILGFFQWRPQAWRVRRETVIAVNVGGCMIPAGVALYQIGHLVGEGLAVMGATAAAVLINTAVCYWLARPIKGVGIVLPGLIPPLVAVLLALVLAPDAAPPRRLCGRCAGTASRGRSAAPARHFSHLHGHSKYRGGRNLRRDCPLRDPGRLPGLAARLLGAPPRSQPVCGS